MLHCLLFENQYSNKHLFGELPHIRSDNQSLLLFLWVKNAYKHENNRNNFGKYRTIMPTLNVHLFQNKYSKKIIKLYVTFGVYSVNDRPTLLCRDWPSVVFLYMMAAHRVAYVGRVMWATKSCDVPLVTFRTEGSVLPSDWLTGWAVEERGEMWSGRQFWADDWRDETRVDMLWEVI